MKRIVSVSALLALCLAALRGEERPRYDLLRFNEDWSPITAAADSDFFDPVKYVDLSGDGVLWLSLGGQVRSRVETWNNFGFGADPRRSDDTFWLNRFRYHADLHVTKYLRGFVEGKSSLSTDRDLPGGRRPIDVDELALQNAFVDLNLPISQSAGLTLRVGRQELLFGSQRLVSPRDWTNVRRTWDGVSTSLEYEWFKLTGFWTALVNEERHGFNSSDPDTQLYGLYATGKRSWLTLDAYLLGLGRDRSLFNGTRGREDRFTLGTRVLGTVPKTGLDFELEGAYQFGEVGSGDVSAFLVSAEAGYSISVVTSPRIFLSFDYASGDRSPGGNVQTFNKLFSTGHKYLGHVDAVGHQNVIAVSPGLSLNPWKKLTTTVRWHLFWRASRDDAFYNAGGGATRAGGLGDSREIGTEVDVTVRYDFDRHFTALAGYGHFFTGKFLEESGSDRDVDFVYLMLQYTF